jgi:hypothetical protein
VTEDLRTALDAHRRRAEAFRWEVPDAFNFGRDVVDRLAAGAPRPALLWGDAAGRERRLSFADAAAGSNRARASCASSGSAWGPRAGDAPRVPGGT